MLFYISSNVKQKELITVPLQMTPDSDINNSYTTVTLVAAV